MEYTNCSTSANGTTSNDRRGLAVPPASLQNKGTNQPNLTALTASDKCGDTSVLTLNVTKSLRAQSGYYEGKKCAYSYPLQGQYLACSCLKHIVFPHCEILRGPYRYHKLPGQKGWGCYQRWVFWPKMVGCWCITSWKDLGLDATLFMFPMHSSIPHVRYYRFNDNWVCQY